MRLFGTWNELPEQKYWSDVYVATRILRYVLPRECCAKGEVVIAGSAALHWYQEKERIGPKWKDPGDIDIFVAGPLGKNKVTFVKFVRCILEAIRRSGHEILWSRVFKNPYCIRNRSVWIVDFKVSGIDMTFSFVQSPKCKKIEEVIAGFDIEVCKVAYHVHSETFTIEAQTHMMIKHHLAVATGTIFSCKGVGPDDFDQKRVLSTLKRIRKYTLRGFEFPCSGGIIYGKPHK